MGYSLHIERIGPDPESDILPIPVQEWSAAVASVEGVRLSTADAHTITNPQTGEVIRLGAREGDAEVLFEPDNEWYPAFRWRGESAAFAAQFKPGDRTHPIWRAAVMLSKLLGAVIRGDEGERYDLETGKIIR